MIYCIEDDSAIRGLMIYTLNTAGYDAAGFPDGESLFEALKKETPQLILLDIMLPGEDGLAILKRLRDDPATRNIPIIMESAKGSEYDRVIGLDMGADDYLSNPFGMMEMVSRVKALLRRTAPLNEPEVLRNRLLELNNSDHTVFVRGERVTALTLKEYELLRLFMENPGRVFTREILFDKIWGLDHVGETRTVDVHIGTLRTKLRECGEYIETVRGVGYRMEGGFRGTDEKDKGKGG